MRDDCELPDMRETDVHPLAAVLAVRTRDGVLLQLVVHGRVSLQGYEPDQGSRHEKKE